jgi:glycosyltransferase involved in cell wall biosynthesis
MRFSIIIPTWEQYGFGKTYLSELLETIKKQTFKNFEVVISDQSVDNEIEKLTSEYSDLTIKYSKNEYRRGNSPANTNNAIKMANGEIIKIMFQDDLFYDNSCLETIHNKFNTDSCKWVVNGCNHTNDGKTFSRNMIPFWNDNILFGNNTISCPSVLSIKKENVEHFDENLVMLMDCEYYYRLYKMYGNPCIIPKTLTSNREHKNQISQRYDKNINDEISYVKNKYKL